MIRSSVILGLFAAMAAAFAQPAAPAFEAASIKPSKAATDGSSWHSRPGYLVMKNQTLGGLIRAAYKLRPEQLSGGPKWIEADRFDVEARAAGPADDPELLAMLKTVLAERFQLVTHTGSRLVSGYALVVSKGELKVSTDPTEGKSRSSSHRGSMEFERASMAKLADSLGHILSAPVVDRTGVSGVFTFKLEFDPESVRLAADGAADNRLGPSLFTVLQQQLGLKLEGHKESLEVVVVDKAEKPTEN